MPRATGSSPAARQDRERLLITGGAGFIGSSFVRHTLETRPDLDICVLDAFTAAANRHTLDDVASRIEVVEGDVRDGALVDRLVARSDLVVHIAAESHNDWSLTGPGAFVQTNLVGTYTTLDAARRHGVRFHQVSTDEVFGALPLDTTERFEPGRAYDPSSPYSATKAGADLLVRAWARSFGVRATISICSNNYGPFQHVEKFIPRQITNLIDGERPKLYGDGRHVRDWIHVADHCAALWRVLDAGVIGRTYLIGANGEHSNLKIVRLLLELFGRDHDDVDFVADRPGHDRRYAIDGEPFQAELGWRPDHRDLRAGLAETVRWYREHEDWWRPVKAATEAAYRATDQA